MHRMHLGFVLKENKRSPLAKRSSVLHSEHRKYCRKKCSFTGKNLNGYWGLKPRISCLLMHDPVLPASLEWRWYGRPSDS